jgi:predicted  nucleic acid-binding Zn-ribbon protein
MTSRLGSARPLLATVVAGGLLLAAVAGCSSGSSSSSQSAADKVCSARSNLRSAVDSVQSDVKSANFGQAKDGLSNVSSSFDQLVQSAKGLKSEEQKALQPQIDAIQNNISNLKNVTSLSDLTTDLSTIGSQFQSLYDDVTNTLKCN